MTLSCVILKIKTILKQLLLCANFCFPTDVSIETLSIEEDAYYDEW